MLTLNLRASDSSSPATGISGYSAARRDGAVHKHQRREPVDEGEVAELLGVELAVRAGADDAAHHHEHAQLLGMVGEGSERLGPRVTALARVEPEGRPDLLGRVHERNRGRQRPDKNDDWDRYFSFHLAQERTRVHESRYAGNTIPLAA